MLNPWAYFKNTSDTDQTLTYAKLKVWGGVVSSDQGLLLANGDRLRVPAGAIVKVPRQMWYECANKQPWAVEVPQEDYLHLEPIAEEAEAEKRKPKAQAKSKAEPIAEEAEAENE